MNASIHSITAMPCSLSTVIQITVAKKLRVISTKQKWSPILVFRVGM